MNELTLLVLAPLMIVSAFAQRVPVADEILSRYPVVEWIGKDAQINVIAKRTPASEALAAIRRALPSISGLTPRAELLEKIGYYIQTKDSAALLTEFLHDPNEEVRCKVIQGLRLMAARFHRGGVKIPNQPADRPAKVDGLVPTLIVAAKDPSPNVRGLAAFALADARDPRATQQIRELLRDSSPGVRFNAAYLLTEFRDASGLGELKARLQRLNKAVPADFDYGSAEMVFAALERITGRSFGEIPLNPGLCSDASNVPRLQEEYLKLLKAWSDYTLKRPAK